MQEECVVVAMPPKARDTPRTQTDGKHRHGRMTKDTTEKEEFNGQKYRQMGREARMKGESRNKPNLSTKARKQFNMGYDEVVKEHRLAAQAEEREEKKEAYLQEIKANIENEEILRMMCDNAGMKKLVEDKYKTMISFIRTILQEEGQDDIITTFSHEIHDLDRLGKKYKRVVNHFTNLVKKLNPKVPGVEIDVRFDEWMKKMQEDSKNIKEKRDQLYNAQNIDEKLREVKGDITPQQITEIKTLIQKKLMAAANKKLHKLAKQKKREKKALNSAASTNRSYDSGISTYSERG